MLTNADCTLYKAQKSGGYTRHVVKNVYWQDSRGANVQKSGLNIADGITVFFYSTDILPKTPTKDMLVKGVAEFEFNNESSQTVSESLKDFREQYSFCVVTAVNDYMYGGLPHIEILAR